MEISVKIISILPAQSFTSAKNGNVYVRNTFVGETTNTQYPRKIAFVVMGDEKFKQMGIVVGGVYNVSFDVESREWKERWFTEAQAWRAQSIDGQVQQQPQSSAPAQQMAGVQGVPQASPQPQPNSQAADALPF